MERSVSKTVNISELKIYSPTKKHHDNNKQISSLYNRDPAHIPDYTVQPNFDFSTAIYPHFPIILLNDGSLWANANLFLLDKLKSINLPSSKTLESLASDLMLFRRWLDTENIDYLLFPKRKLARPTYRYCVYLYQQIDSDKLSRNTARRRMSSIQGFYRWLQNTQGIDFGHQLWQENEVFISYKDPKGFSRLKTQITTDQSIKVPRNNNDYSEYLQDGGKLRPLLKEEQQALINALLSIGNTEMTLAFLVALTSGARLQTIFTLRICHYSETQPENSTEKRIKVGACTLVSTKNNKQIVIRIPTWLYDRICIYLSSPRAARRRDMSKYVYEDDAHQYAFLTRNGAPYYISDTDPFITRYRNPPRGIAVSNFIKQQLKPMLEQHGNSFSIRFHDLRATFGMNLLEEKMRNVGKEGLIDVLMLVKERMGHSSLATTEAYLNYRRNYKLALSVQSEFEAYLMKIAKDLI